MTGDKFFLCKIFRRFGFDIHDVFFFLVLFFNRLIWIDSFGLNKRWADAYSIPRIVLLDKRESTKTRYYVATAQSFSLAKTSSNEYKYKKASSRLVMPFS